MKRVMKLGAGYRTYLIGIATILHGLANILGGDMAGGIVEILKSPEVAEMLFGAGLITARYAITAELAKAIEIAARSGISRSGKKSILAAVAGIGAAVGMIGCAGVAERYDERCLSRCAADCAMACESRCRLPAQGELAGAN